ncbi:MAG: helix-turn-helix domain-containing protein [Lachnospiraceae bacterium]|nr:helix-turn-helix domain-containing protein [Lachnospiraceae bacterium]
MNSSTATLTMSVEEAAKELGICVKIAYDLTHRQDFPTIKIGRRTRISREGLREWVRQQEQSRKETTI